MDRTTAPMTTADLWTYRDMESWQDTEITGFSVEAIDGEIGAVDEATYDAGGSFIVVDTGPWIFGRKVMLPAGVLTSIDFDEQRVRVNRTKDQIENAPEFDESSYRDDAYRTDLGGYYGEGGRGYRDW